MRKIEESMVNAINNGKNWHSGNTCVRDGEVFLHGNRIAYIVGDTLYCDADTLAQWPTMTTRSRLRALGFIVKGNEWLGWR